MTDNPINSKKFLMTNDPSSLRCQVMDDLVNSRASKSKKFIRSSLGILSQIILDKSGVIQSRKILVPPD